MGTVHVDASYAGGNSDGSLLKPYTSLVTALTARLTEGATDFLTFKLNPGVYTGAVNINRTTATQSFCIEGSGPESTFVQAGTTFAAGAADDVLELRDFLDITFKDFTVRHGAYGLYPRNCRSCTVQNVRFVHLGSDGTANRHDLTGDQNEQAAFWQSASTSNGGACRIRTIGRVHVSNCTVDHCARGLRIQDCGLAENCSIVSGNRISRTLESGIYLAAGSYTGSDGCVNFKICNNIVHEAFNNGVLLIGGHKCTVVANTIVGTANAGIQQWHGLDNSIIGNTVTNCNRLQHNGVGNLGDAHD
jgi:parallel beta-helix repeat protein